MVRKKVVVEMLSYFLIIITIVFLLFESSLKNLIILKIEFNEDRTKW
jgi:hypothetical protein